MYFKCFRKIQFIQILNTLHLRTQQHAVCGQIKFVLARKI